jgi:hypothetical protein
VTVSLITLNFYNLIIFISEVKLDKNLVKKVLYSFYNFEIHIK